MNPESAEPRLPVNSPACFVWVQRELNLAILVVGVFW